MLLFLSASGRFFFGIVRWSGSLLAVLVIEPLLSHVLLHDMPFDLSQVFGVIIGGIDELPSRLLWWRHLAESDGGHPLDFCSRDE